MTIQARTLILASQSAYRRELLGRLTADFTAVPAAVDETPQPGEVPALLASRLSLAKAEAVATANPEALVIGSDQVAALDGLPLGKPGGPSLAAEQLRACSGKEVIFYTGTTVRCRATGYRDSHTDITTVKFRTLTAADIDAYLHLDAPWDCAGSFKAEAHGSLLFTAIVSQDPSAIIGLPLIWLAGSLRRAGLDLLHAGAPTPS